MPTTRKKRATLSDVANKAGVAISTASVVLNYKDNVVPVAEKTKAKVLAAARQLDYVPNAAARALNTRRSNIVGVMGGAASYAEAERTRGIRNFLEARGYSIRVLPHSGPGAIAAEPLQAYRSQMIDGLILVGGHRLLPSDKLKRVIQEGMPVVTADVDVQHPRVPCVNIASYDGYSAVIRHLISHGYEHIALITGGMLARPTRECLRAYKDALSAAGIDYDDRYVIEGDWHASSGYYSMKELLSRGIPIRAVQAGNDMMASGAIRAIEEHGLRVPVDIAVAGYDDDVPLPSNCFCPALTTVAQPFFRLGNEVAALLHDMLNGRQPIWNSLIPVDLVVRESCGCNLPDLSTRHHPDNCAQARSLPHNVPVELKDYVVSAVFGHAFYVQDPEASSGIGVMWNDTLSRTDLTPGDIVSVAGRMLTTQGETMLGDAFVAKTGSGEAPAAIDMDLAHLRARVGLGGMLGVLMTTKGTVTTFSSDRTRCVTIEGTDGARANVLLMETDYYPEIGDRVAVTGITADHPNGVPWLLALRVSCI